MADEEIKTPLVGKHILSTLTCGMYQDPRMIFREYIQNSADQIDTLSADEQGDNLRKTINIEIDPVERRVVITDQATGIPKAQFLDRLLNVADSHKDPSKNKGFRGIGRLAGLSYCEKLVFESSARGETGVSRLEMDGFALARILHDAADHSLAGDVMRTISTYEFTKNGSREYDCHFKVVLEGVRKDVGKPLLDVESVKGFIAQVAPLPFSRVKFRAHTAIEEAAQRAGVAIEEYTVRVNGEVLTKPYKDVLCDAQGRKLGDVGEPVFREFRWHDRLLAWGWFILPAQGVSLPKSQNPERKIRLRKGNIQIGFSDFLDPYFPEARSNGYMLGEIHLVSNEILPSGDRNALEVSEESSAFVETLKTRDFRDLWNSAHKANELKNATKAVTAYRDIKDKVDTAIANGNRDVAESLHEELEKAYGKAVAGQQKLKKAIATPARGEFVKNVIQVLTDASEERVAPIDKPAPLPASEEESSSRRTTQSTAKGGQSRVGQIVEVLRDEGIDVMKALELAKKIDEKLSSTEE